MTGKASRKTLEPDSYHVGNMVAGMVIYAQPMEFLVKLTGGRSKL